MEGVEELVRPGREGACTLDGTEVGGVDVLWGALFFSLLPPPRPSMLPAVRDALGVEAQVKLPRGWVPLPLLLRRLSAGSRQRGRLHGSARLSFLPHVVEFLFHVAEILCVPRAKVFESLVILPCHASHCEHHASLDSSVDIINDRVGDCVFPLLSPGHAPDLSQVPSVHSAR